MSSPSSVHASTHLECSPSVRDGGDRFGRSSPKRDDARSTVVARDFGLYDGIEVTARTVEVPFRIYDECQERGRRRQGRTTALVVRASKGCIASLGDPFAQGWGKSAARPLYSLPMPPRPRDQTSCVRKGRNPPRTRESSEPTIRESGHNSCCISCVYVGSHRGGSWTDGHFSASSAAHWP